LLGPVVPRRAEREGFGSSREEDVSGAEPKVMAETALDPALDALEGMIYDWPGGSRRARATTRRAPRHVSAGRSHPRAPSSDCTPAAESAPI
jgi:hypothetical protein